MEMGTGADTGHSGISDHRSGRYIIAGTVLAEAGEVLIQGCDPAAVIDPDIIAAGTAVAGIHDSTARHCNYGITDSDAYVDGLMVSGSSGYRCGTVSEIGGDVMAGRYRPYPTGLIVGRGYFFVFA